MAAEKKTKPRAKRVTFAVRAEPGSSVSLAGDFNDWNPDSKTLVDKDGTGLFTTTLNLVAGAYEYKFVINGTWCVDPECKEWVQNSLGTLNSVVRVE